MPTIEDHPNLFGQSPLVLPGFTWEQYLSIEELFEESGVQIRFLQGKLEIMPPVSEYHENRKSHIARLVETWCVEKDVNFFGKGNYTMLNPEESGGEPDECYCLREIATIC